MKKITFLFAILFAASLINSRAQSNALSFDGANDYVNVGNPSILQIDDYISVEAWVKPTVSTSRIMGKYENELTSGWRLFYGSSIFYFGVSSGSGDHDISSTVSANVNEWHHVAGTYDKSSGRLCIYVDGVLTEQNGYTLGNLLNTSDDFVIGRYAAWGIGYYNGEIDEVRIWNVARTQAEIQANMYTSLTGNETGLVTYYRFNQGIAGGNNLGVTTLNDVTANNNDGQLINFALTGNTSNWVAGFPGNPQNTSYGTNALISNTSGLYNSAFGYYSLYKNTTGNNNSAFGYHSLYFNTSGNSNIAFGSQALYSNTIGTENTALGTFALLKNKSGSQNTANGTNALYANTTGNYNTATGVAALTSNTTGSSNTAKGFSALSSNTTGSSNTATGYFALITNTTGTGNTATGWSALSNNTTGKYNTALGNNANTSIGNLTNSTALGRGSLITASNQVRIGNSSVTSIGGYTGWSNISDGRYKVNLKEDVPGLEFINALRPVTYNLKVTELDGFLRRDIRKTGKNDGFLSQQSEIDKNATAEKERVIYTGFVAQEVERAAKEIGYDFSGVDAPKNDHDVYALRYAEFVVPLVKAVQELSQQNYQLKNELAEIKKLLMQRTQNDAIMSPTNGNEKLSVTVSPNPVRSVLNVNIKGNCNRPVITALDTYGKIILVKPLTQNKTELDVSKLAAGTYIIKITDADGKQLYSGKFLKQN